MISLDRRREVGYTETPPRVRVRFRSETYAAEWRSSLRNRIESNCKFGTYLASATKLFLLQLVLLTCSDPNFDTPYLTVTRTCPTRPLSFETSQNGTSASRQGPVPDRLTSTLLPSHRVRRAWDQPWWPNARGCRRPPLRRARGGPSTRRRLAVRFE